jgi:regulator of sigma E protease
VDQRTNDDRDEPVIQAEEAAGPWLRRNGPILVVLAALTAFAAYKGWSIGTIGIVVFGLGLVIFVHELGHFLAAKWCNVFVETFSIGFGPAVPFCHYHLGETTYKVGLIPLGGYVKMLGEGSEADEQEDDPRSFKNKSVGQRMLIISAGVMMNMVFAVIGFVCIYMGPGRDRTAGVIGRIDPGSPAWKAGLRSSAEFRRVGSRDNPFFDQVRPAVALAGSGVKLPISYSLPGSDRVIETSIEPRFDAKNVGLKLIGVGPAYTTTLRGSPRLNEPAYTPSSAASHAEPPINHNDTIIATTDPANPNGPLLDLPHDPRNAAPDRRDFFELHRRMVDLEGQPVKFLLQPEGGGQPHEVTVPPMFARNLGLIMRMGPITAVKDNSPAAKAGIQPRVEAGAVGDVIERVDIKSGDRLIRYCNWKSTSPPSGIEERPLDPMRLPLELEKWAATASDRTVVLGVLRLSGHDERTKVDVELSWDASWKYARETPLSFHAPVPISGLGIAYQVEPVIEDVVKGEAADQKGLKAGDVITAARLYRDAKLTDTETIPLKQDERNAAEWPFVFYLLHELVNPNRIDLTVERSGKPIEVAFENLAEDLTWPMEGRGLRFADDNRHQIAESPTQALKMGSQDVLDTAINVYLSLVRMIEGGISFWKTANGPIAIAATSYNVASESVTSFVLLLCVLSVNLAVLNFLPIPVLDGGHMVFLLYEKLAGRPAPEIVRTSATFAGMALLLSLMACVIVLDVMRVIFKS